jgi:hypothetical protein
VSSERSGSPTPTLELIVRSSPTYPSLCARGREQQFEEREIERSTSTLDAESERGMKSEWSSTSITGSGTCIKADQRPNTSPGEENEYTVPIEKVLIVKMVN